MKLACIGDVHLDNFNSFSTQGITAITNSRMDNLLNAIKTVFEYSRKNDLDGLVINGDLFNQRIMMNPSLYNYCVDTIMDELDSCKNGFQFFINIGNHDEGTPYIVYNSCTLFERMSTKEHPIFVASNLVDVVPLSDNSNLVFVPFTTDTESSKKKIQEIVPNVQNATIFAHLGVVNSVSGRWNHKLGGEYTLDDLTFFNENVVNCILSHYHNRQFLYGTSKSTKACWYIGDLLPLNANDVEKNGMGSDRGFDVVDTLTGEHKFIKLTGKRYGFPKFDIIDMNNTKLSLEDIENLIDDDYVTIRVSDKNVLKKLKEFAEKENKLVKFDLIPNLKEETSDIKIDTFDTPQEITKSYINNSNYHHKEKLIKKATEYLDEL